MGVWSAKWCDQLMTHRDIVTCDCDARRLVTHPQLHQCYVTLLTYRGLVLVCTLYNRTYRMTSFIYDLFITVLHYAIQKMFYFC